MEKIFTLFVLVIAGAIMALMLLFAEIYVLGLRPRRPDRPGMGPNRPKLHSLSSHPYFIATALDSVQNLQRLLKGQQHNTDTEGIHKSLRELQNSLQEVQREAKMLHRLK